MIDWKGSIDRLLIINQLSASNLGRKMRRRFWSLSRSSIRLMIRQWVSQSVRKSLVSGSPWQDSSPSLSPVFNQLPVFSFSFSSVSPTKHEAQKIFFGLLFIFYQTSFHLSSRAELAVFQLREKELPKSIKVNWTGETTEKKLKKRGIWLHYWITLSLTHTQSIATQMSNQKNDGNFC